MASADVAVTGSAELGVAGSSSADVKLHKDIDVNFSLSGATDTGLSFGASIDLDEAAAENNAAETADKGQSTFDAQGHVFISGVFGTLTLGDTDGGFDKALTEVGSATSIADNHTSHPGYNGNSGLDGFTGNGGNILRYDYSLGGITTSVSGEFNSGDSSHSAIGVGVAWAGDVGGIGMGVGIGWQGGSGKMDMVDGAMAVAAVPAMPQMAGVPTNAVDPAEAVYQCQATTLNQQGTPDDPTDDDLHPILTSTVTEDTDCMDDAIAANGDPQNAAVAGVEYILVLTNRAAVAGTPRGIPTPAMPAQAAVAAIDDSYDVGKASIIGASWSIDMGNGLTTALNYSRRTDQTSNSVRDANNSQTTTTHTGIGVGYAVGDMTIGVNGGSSTVKTGAMETKNTGVGVAVVYSLGTGVNFQVGAGSGKKGDAKQSSWSAGLAFSF